MKRPAIASTGCSAPWGSSSLYSSTNQASIDPEDSARATPMSRNAAATGTRFRETRSTSAEQTLAAWEKRYTFLRATASASPPVGSSSTTTVPEYTASITPSWNRSSPFSRSSSAVTGRVTPTMNQCRL